MSKKPGSGLGLLIILCIWVIISPIIIITWVIKKILKNFNVKNFKNSEDANQKLLQNQDTQIYPNMTVQKIKNISKAKLNALSNNQKKLYLQKQKKFLKSVYITIGSICIFCILLGILLYLSGKDLLISLTIIILFAVLSLISFISLTQKLKQPEETLILKQLEKELVFIYSTLTEKKVKNVSFKVQEHSALYKEIVKLNDMYVFNKKICKEHIYYIKCKTKYEFDNFDFEQFIINKIRNNLTFFENFEIEYDANCRKYIEYIEKYKKIENYTSISDLEDFDLDFETYHYIEKILYSTNKQEKITKPSVTININYTTPAGRYVYENEKTYLLKNILKFIDIAKQPKKIKERKFSNIEKQRLELEQKWAEFYNMTQGHIYSADIKENKNDFKEIEKLLTLSQKFKLLKNKLNNGEITINEYQTERKELFYNERTINR